MTDLQQRLIDTLAARHISAVFSGDSLQGEAHTTRKGKRVAHRFSMSFDDAATLDGVRVLRVAGSFGEAFARDAFFEAIRLGQGDEAALRFVCECAESGVSSGATQSFIEAHRAEIDACRPAAVE